MQIDQAAIQEAVIARVSEEILDDWNWREDAKAHVQSRINKAFDEGFEAIVKSAVNDAVSAGFDHAYQRVDSFGKPVGQPTTVRKELDQLIQNYWTQRVDSSGKPTDSTYRSTTRAEWMMVQICGKDFGEQVKSVVVSSAGTFKDAVRDQLRGSIDKMLNETFRVKSKNDQLENRYVP